MTKVSAFDPNYGDLLSEANIRRRDERDNPPSNYGEICLFMSRERDDLEVDEDKLLNYKTKVRRARTGKESGLRHAVSPDLFDSMELPASDWLSFQTDQQWTNQDLFSTELGRPEPDHALGLHNSGKILKDRIIACLAQDHFRYFKMNEDLVCPLLAVEYKGPGGTIDQAEKQNQHNGACMVKNIVALKRAVGQPLKQYRDRAQALTIEIHNECIQLSCHWTDGNDKYYSMQVGECVHLSDWSKVCQIIRNAFDWTKLELEKLDTLVFQPLEKTLSRSRKRRRSFQLERQGSEKRSRRG